MRATHGPEAADQVVAGILDGVRRGLRGTDVVAYVGDHEIAALLAHADMDAAKTTADAIREAAQNLRVETAHGPVGTDVSVGVASLVGAGFAGPRVRRRRAGDAARARAPRTSGASCAGARARPRLGGELARLLAGLEARLGAGRAQLVGGAGVRVGARQDAVGLERAGDRPRSRGAAAAR